MARLGIDREADEPDGATVGKRRFGVLRLADLRKRPRPSRAFGVRRRGYDDEIAHAYGRPARATNLIEDVALENDAAMHLRHVRLAPRPPRKPEMEPAAFHDDIVPDRHVRDAPGLEPVVREIHAQHRRRATLEAVSLDHVLPAPGKAQVREVAEAVALDRDVGIQRGVLDEMPDKRRPREVLNFQ